MPVSDDEARRLLLQDMTAVSVPDVPVPRTGRIQVRSCGVVIYSGPGSLDMTDGGTGELSVWITVVHVPSGQRRSLSLTGPLVHGASTLVEFRMDPETDWASDHIPCPVPDLVTLDLGLPPGVAEYLRTELNRSPVPAGPGAVVSVRDDLRRAFGLPEDLLGDDARLERMREFSTQIRESLAQVGSAVSAAAEGIRAFRDAVGSPEELRRSLGFDDQDALIASTRAEFPSDPHEYGRRYAGDSPMHWTPPAEGEEVPKWLA